MKKYFAILTVFFCILSNASIAQDSSLSLAQENQKNSRFNEKLRENREKREKRIEQIQQRSQKRHEEMRERRDERRRDRRDERRSDRREERRQSSSIENSVNKMPNLDRNQQIEKPSQPREMRNGERR